MQDGRVCSHDRPIKCEGRVGGKEKAAPSRVSACEARGQKSALGNHPRSYKRPGNRFQNNPDYVIA
eukprot:804895-Prorocentrum_minimum.AAC.1